MTFADNRALIVFPDDFPDSYSELRDRFYPLVYLIEEDGEFVPSYEIEPDNYYVTFTRIALEFDPEKRERAIRKLYENINYDDHFDFDTMIVEIIKRVREMLHFDISSYESDIVRIFTDAYQEEQRMINECPSEIEGN